MKRYTIEVNEHQLRLIAQCIEDLNRFYSGQMGLSNTANILDSKRKVMLQDELDKLKPVITPDLPRNVMKSKENFWQSHIIYIERYIINWRIQMIHGMCIMVKPCDVLTAVSQL